MKPSIPKGTRDFGPQEMARRNYIFNTIREVYELYGFQQIETPAMETLQTLMGKYGEEGDKLLFKILNSGDFLSKVSDDELKERNALHLAARLCEKGLRYDLTVPFARYVVMHREELQLPFKRYQVQPVWRADRPQKGRYREFYQFDGDVVGSDSLLNEVELMQIVDTVFSRFGVRVQIKINNRKILTGIAEVIGAADKIVDITVAIDKLDKIGIDNVNAELREDGLTEEQIQKLQPIILLQGTNEEKLNTIAKVLADSETGMKGVEETRFILEMLNGTAAANSTLYTLNSQLELDLTLARGLNYYTGAIFEVKALDVQIGSITGGGRYDNLTGIFGMPGISGVGISFGTGTSGWHPHRGVPRRREDEEADGLCQRQAYPLRRPGWRQRDCRRQGNAEGHGHRRPAHGDARSAARKATEIETENNRRKDHEEIFSFINPDRGIDARCYGSKRLDERPER